MTTALKPKGQFSFPKGMGIFPVVGDCMEPVIRDRQMVFAVRQELSPVATGTPVIIITAEKTLIKLWGGIRGDQVILRFLNDGQGGTGAIAIPACEITEIWIIQGIWFNGVPMQARSGNALPVFSCESFAAMVKQKNSFFGKTPPTAIPTPPVTSQTSSKPKRQVTRSRRQSAWEG